MKNQKRIVVTGGCGFIGSHFIKMILAETNWRVINLDALTYAGRLENLKEVADNPRYRFVRGSITNRELVFSLVKEADMIANLAAESHVDNSIKSPAIFVETNVLGTQVLLDAARKHGVEKFLQVSTDEVYGSLPIDSEERFTENYPLVPSSPYSASKTASDLLCRAAYLTHGLPVVVSRCSNNYGTHQLAEKLIPVAITKALKNQLIPVYGDGQNVRDWIHVADHCRALLIILQKGRIGEIYNIGGNNEISNIELVRSILRILEKPESLIEFVTDRLGHDRRYAINSGKLEGELKWQRRQADFKKELSKVIEFHR